MRVVYSLLSVVLCPLCSNQLKVFSSEDNKGVRDVNLPTVARGDPSAPLSATAVDEASGMLDITRYALVSAADVVCC
jgi:uncharacterized protein YbaR (Trm112 family)